jgi:hypothetical protein
MNGLFLGKGRLQLGPELAGGTALLVEPSPVTALAVTTVTTVAAGATALVTTAHAGGRNVGAGLLDVGGRDDLGGEVEPLAEVGETGLSQGVVVVLPRELGLDVAPGGERLARLDDLCCC